MNTLHVLMVLYLPKNSFRMKCKYLFIENKKKTHTHKLLNCLRANVYLYFSQLLETIVHFQETIFLLLSKNRICVLTDSMFNLIVASSFFFAPCRQPDPTFIEDHLVFCMSNWNFGTNCVRLEQKD